jgi:regulator of sigma E protease
MTHTWVGIVLAIVGLGIIVLVHEWGHFIVARLSGVRVDVFSIGYGNRIFGWKRGDTDYRISLFPLGGYVKMAGDNPAEERKGTPDEFLSVPKWKRFFIIVAGPAMNVVLAFFLVWGLYVVGIPVPRYFLQPAVIAGVLPNSPAAKAGVEPNDRLVEINGTKIATWNDVDNALIAPGHVASIEVERAGAVRTFKVDVPEKDGGLFSVIGYPAVKDVIVASVEPGFPAAKAGVHVGDEVLALDGVKNPNPAPMVQMVRDSGGKPIRFDLRRNGKEMSVVVEPIFADPGDGGGKRWLIGALFDTGDTYRQSFTILQAAHESFTDNQNMVEKIFGVLAGLFSGQVSIKDLAGPIGIVVISSQMAKSGAEDFIHFMALLSINLGILNLLPIPILDGGHVLMLAIEGTLRRELSLAAKERFVQVGLVFLIAVFAFVMYYDVVLRVLNR